MKAFITTVDAIFHNSISEEYLDKTKALKIPMYQREYLWEQKNISDLIGDIQIRDMSERTILCWIMVVVKGE